MISWNPYNYCDNLSYRSKQVCSNHDTKYPISHNTTQDYVSAFVACTVDKPPEFMQWIYAFSKTLLGDLL